MKKSPQPEPEAPPRIVQVSSEIFSLDTEHALLITQIADKEAKLKELLTSLQANRSARQALHLELTGLAAQK